MKEKPRREKYGFFLLETLKTSFKMRNLTQDGHNQGTFFQFLKKGRETRDLPPSPPLVSRLTFLLMETFTYDAMA